MRWPSSVRKAASVTRPIFRLPLGSGAVRGTTVVLLCPPPAEGDDRSSDCVFGCQPDCAKPALAPKLSAIANASDRSMPIIITGSVRYPR